MFQFDTHVHTSEVSSCGGVKAEDMVKLYIEASYSGVCVTDHYYNWFFGAKPEESWEEGVTRYLAGYRNAKAYGDAHDFTVLLGAEIRFADSPNDYLLFGITEEFLYEHPKLYELSREEFKKLAEEHGILIFQAHPFRPNITPENPVYLDGVEVFNGNPRQHNRNELALEFANENGLLHCGGSDFHQVQDVGTSGIRTNKEIKDSRTLLDVLRAREFELIK